MNTQTLGAMDMAMSEHQEATMPNMTTGRFQSRFANLIKKSWVMNAGMAMQPRTA